MSSRSRGKSSPSNSATARVVLLHPPLPEVEVDVRDAVLDRRPERPAVLRHQPPEARPRHLVAQRPAVVVADQLLQLVERQVRLAPHVAELEAGVVVPRILVVDQPELAAGVDEVLGQEVVVARHRALVADAHRLLDLAHLGLELGVPLGQPEPAVLDQPQVTLLDPEHVEVVAEAAGAVQAPAGGGDHARACRRGAGPPRSGSLPR